MPEDQPKDIGQIFNARPDLIQKALELKKKRDMALVPATPMEPATPTPAATEATSVIEPTPQLSQRDQEIALMTTNIKGGENRVPLLPPAEQDPALQAGINYLDSDIAKKVFPTVSEASDAFLTALELRRRPEISSARVLTPDLNPQVVESLRQRVSQDYPNGDIDRIVEDLIKMGNWVPLTGFRDQDISQIDPKTISDQIEALVALYHATDNPPSSKTESTSLVTAQIRKDSPAGAIIRSETSDASPIHPDIEAGAVHILEKRLTDSVKVGNVAGIELAMSDLVKAWEQAQKASGGRFEMTPEGHASIQERVRNLVAANLTEGLKTTFKHAAYQISQANMSGLNEEATVNQLFGIAQELQIPLTFTPVTEAGQSSSQLPTVVFATAQEAQAYLQDVINRNLPAGVKHLINDTALEVGHGLLRRVPDIQKKLDEWIGLMKTRGWSVVDRPSQPVLGEAASQALLTRQINMAEIRQLMDQAIKDNLAKGVKAHVDTVAYSVKTGLSNPLDHFGKPEDLSLYEHAGQSYTQPAGEKELTAHNPSAVIGFDPDNTSAQIAQAVRDNLADGLEAIEARHLDAVKAALVSQVEYSGTTLEQYLALAKQYGVAVNAPALREELKSHINPDNLQAGVATLQKEMQENLRQGRYFLVANSGARVEAFRRFVEEAGFSDKVDFSQLDQYLEETATQAPRLTQGNP